MSKIEFLKKVSKKTLNFQNPFIVEDFKKERNIFNGGVL